jgi:CBS domain-containing protein
MPYSVDHLIENQKKVLSIQKTDQLTHALDLMIEYDYSQLPVIDENGRIFGMVTYESILRATRSFSAKIDKLLARDAIVKAPHHYREDDLFDILDDLMDRNVVVIIEPEGFPIGIVTSYDSAKFLRNRTEDLLYIEDIEFIIKELIKKAYANSKGQIENEKMENVVIKPNEPRSAQSGSKKPKTLEELTLADYINLLMSREIWGFVTPILQIQKESLHQMLDNVRQTRNDLAHFRGEISPSSRDELRNCANWLRKRYQVYEKELDHTIIDSLLEQTQVTKLFDSVREVTTDYKTTLEDKKQSIVTKSVSQSRYAALANWLSQQKEAQISLTFEQIEKIVRSPLPDSAFQSRAWWANDRAGHYHSKLWLEAGWKVIYVDISEKQVIFTRHNPAESV